ncbi:MAG TPA: hypothetical protein VH916_13595 [Dehalococcoidia bacterium]
MRPCWACACWAPRKLAAGQWFTLARFKDDPRHLTGISQARTAQEALDQLTAWEAPYLAETTIALDPARHPLERPALTARAAAPIPPPRSQTAA